MKHFMDIERAKFGSELAASNVDGFEVGDIIQISEKWDGCFNYNTQITLANGEKLPIGKIVNQNLDVEVLSYNFETNSLEPSKILNYYKHGDKKPFIAVYLDSPSCGNECRILCTADHLFYTNIGWLPAEKLEPHISVYTTAMDINEEQKQLVLGTMLGDSSIYPVLKENNSARSHGIVYIHSNKQTDYVEFKKGILGNLFLRSECVKTGYGSDATRSYSHCTMSIEKELRKCVDENFKKRVSVEWLKDITSIGLAFWYMDDGSLNKGSNGQRERATLHTEGFTEEENDIIAEMLFIKFGIAAHKIFYKDKYYRIDLSADGSDRFFSMIAPYIDKSMAYKLPSKFRNNCGYYWDNYHSVKQTQALVPYHIKSVDLNPPEEIINNKINYDIETSNHNYFANGLLVHNSNASIRYDVDTETLVAFSRKQTLNFNNTLNGFYNYVQQLDAKLFADTPNYVVFGEWGNKNKIIYRPECYHRWYVYDIYDVENQQYLPQDTVKAFAESHGLEYIHVLYEGPFISWDHCRTFMNSPAYGNSQEGVVVKSQTKLNDPNTRQPFYLKLVNESFSEVMKTREKTVDPEKETEKAKAQQIVESIVTKRRVEKELYKMRDEGIVPEQISPSDMRTVAQNLPKRIYEDCLKEEKEAVMSAGEWFGKLCGGQAMKFAREIILGQ